MAVSIDCLVGEEPGGSAIGWALYAIAHRYEVNGDLVSDPDVACYVANDPARSEAVAVYPRWTPQNRPWMDRSKPAIRKASETGDFYPAATS